MAGTRHPCRVIQTTTYYVQNTRGHRAIHWQRIVQGLKGWTRCVGWHFLHQIRIAERFSSMKWPKDMKLDVLEPHAVVRDGQDEGDVWTKLGVLRHPVPTSGN
ncbi:Mitochondrial Carrier (MC) Family [Phytophthora palmivora]|uniref:Mitochondrial Carrier (MC) Family n=1 Tax=Phytophthora palmivora TaxID=4796 RepID=A0A2P4YR86_9STRA|nr:Mitochondrial Carrier (MC) Family [Phytophthora palmivora]